MDVLKGGVQKLVQIENHIKSNCSMLIRDVGSNYYVFGNANSEGNKIVMDGFPSFVREPLAIDKGMLQKLSIISE